MRGMVSVRERAGRELERVTTPAEQLLLRVTP
jgi:hypothetical protein